jgi:hypothetical protein
VTLSPFFGIELDEYVKYLWLHMRWHTALGASRYLLYANANITQLIEHPSVQVKSCLFKAVVTVCQDDALPNT